jgi:hypothetical protein
MNEPSVLIFQLLHHPYRESLDSVLKMDFTGMNVNVFYAIFSSACGSRMIDEKEYREKTQVLDVTSEYASNQRIAQLEKTRLMGDMVLKYDYDYALYVTDNMVCGPDALQKLIAEKKDCISGLVGPPDWTGDQRAFSGRVRQTHDGYQPDDRQMELHRDYEFGDVIQVTNAVTVFILFTKSVFQSPNYDGFNERQIWDWLYQNKLDFYVHTGVRIIYLPANWQGI